VVRSSNDPNRPQNGIRFCSNIDSYDDMDTENLKMIAYYDKRLEYGYVHVTRDLGGVGGGLSCSRLLPSLIRAATSPLSSNIRAPLSEKRVQWF